MPSATFIDYDAKHRINTLQDLSTINAHKTPSVTFIGYNAKHRTNNQQDLRTINSHVARRAKLRAHDKAKHWSAPSPMESQIGGLRTDPFGMLRIDSTWDVSRAFDYCETFYS